MGDDILSTAKIKCVYDKLSDELSKELFMNRIMYSLTSDYDFIIKLTRLTPEGKQLSSLFQSFSGSEHAPKKRLIIYGAGGWGSSIQKTFPDVKWDLYCDKKASSSFTNFRGLPVISPETLALDYTDAVIVVATVKYHQEIVNDLYCKGFQKEQVINVGSVVESMYANQYFDLDILPKTPNEVFVDGGCLDGQSFLGFHRWCGGSYQAIHAFEPDQSSLEKCKKAATISSNRISIHNKGLWRENAVLHFSSGLGGASRIATGGDISIDVVSLDQCLVDIIPTFIKLDIEGAELDALIGSKNLITKYKPKIAVCLYHKESDIWEIPSYLLQLRNDYQFYIRHYSLSAIETVLYAI